MPDLLLGAAELDLLHKSRLNYWVGESPPLPGFVASNDVLSADNNFRLHPDMHGSFDGVFYLEHDLGHAKQWRLILDELLRLTDGAGVLVLRFTPGPYFGTHELMHAVRSWANGQVEVISSRQWKGDSSRVVGFSFSMPPRVRSLESITFGIIVDGRFPDRLTRFVDSVESLDGLTDVDYEILVCGPEHSLDQLDPRAKHVRLILQDERFSDQGWITRKKNKIIAEASGGLLVLAHDRYSLLPDFLIQLRSYGPDFDVLIPRQRTESGARYPSVVATRGLWDLSAIAELEQGDYLPTIYINGGILIAHTEVLRRTPYNELLFWAEAEDVELSRRLSFDGVVPRFSNGVTVLSDLTRSDQVSVFQRLPYVGEYLVPSVAGSFYELGSLIEFDGSARVLTLHEAGVVLPRQWSSSETGLVWRGPEMPEFSIKPSIPKTPVTRVWTLTLGFHGAKFASENLELIVNGKRAPLNGAGRRGDVDELTFSLPEDLVAAGHTFLVQFARGLPALATLRSLRLSLQTEKLSLPMKLQFTEPSLPPIIEMKGWAAFEELGVWTNGPSSTIRIPILQRRPGHDLVLEFRVEPFLSADNEQRVVVGVNGSPREIWAFMDNDVKTRSLRVPAMPPGRDSIDVTFDTAWPTAPMDVGRGADARALGIFLSRLSIREALRGGHE